MHEFVLSVRLQLYCGSNIADTRFLKPSTARWVARWPAEPRVAGSIPDRGRGRRVSKCRRALNNPHVGKTSAVLPFGFAHGHSCLVALYPNQ